MCFVVFISIFSVNCFCYNLLQPKQHPAKTNQERNKKVSAPPEQKKSAGALPQVTMRKELQKTWISQFSPLTSPPPSIEKMRCRHFLTLIGVSCLSLYRAVLNQR